MGAAGGVWIKGGLALAGLVLAASASAQLAAEPSGGFQWRSSGSNLGLNPAHAAVAIGCGSSLLPCRSPEEAAAASRLQDDHLRWTVELGVLNLGATGIALSPGRQGLNLSLVGRRPLSLFGSRFSVYGKLGTTYGVADPAVAATPVPPLEGGYGLSFGAGVSMDFTPRLSGSFGFDSHELRLGGGPRDPVRSTSLGLQFRY
jgi:OOP family OmpA-OmpF porin